MPAAKKNKLLLRQVAKDEQLCRKLTYDLLEEALSWKTAVPTSAAPLTGWSKQSNTAPAG
jgi:hypothetical protein